MGIPVGTQLSTFVHFLVPLVVVIGLFLLLREALTWYWKINRMVELMERAVGCLERIETGNEVAKP
jgi:hypothetical protein